MDQMLLASRIVIFIVGICCGYWNKRGVLKNKVYSWVIVMICLFMGYKMFMYFQNNYSEKIWIWGLNWYPFVIITPALCYVLAYIFEIIDRIKKLKFIIKVLEVIGAGSFEIYLLHVYPFAGKIGAEYSNGFWIILSAFFIIFGIFYHYAITYTLSLYRMLRN